MKKALSAALVCATAALSAHGAAVVNGNFEGGTLSGWYATGANVNGSSTAVVNAGNGYQALSGNNSALIVAMSLWPLGSNVTCASDIWNVACPLPVPFSPSGAGAPTYFSMNVAGRFLRGGFIAQDVSVAAGDTLSWMSQRLGEVASGSVGNPGNVDNAYFVAFNGLTEAVVDLRGGVSSYTFAQGGLWSIFFGVQQTEDPYIWSALKVDSIAFQSAQVPEPDSLALAVAALGGLVLRRRRTKG